MPINAGMGSSGVDPNSRLAQDLAGLSDPAKRVAETRQAAVEANAARNLKTLQAGQAARAKSLNDQAADFVMKSLKPDPDKNPAGYKTDLEIRIADMETKAKEAKKSKNVTAEQTYMQVAEILRKRLHGMQNAEMQIDAGEPTTMPAEGAQ